MRLKHTGFNTRGSVLAVHSALLALAFASGAHAADNAAEDPAVTELVRPTSSIEIGLGGVDGNSAKFGEYNGLGKTGLYGIGNFELKGGGAWNSNDATRWSVRGSDLGLETRDLAVEYGEQGKYRLNFGYGELLRNQSDSYMTPFRGAGTRNLTLPSNWLRPCVPTVNANAVNFRGLDPTIAPAGNCTPTPPPVAAAYSIQTARTNDLPLFYNFDLKTKRSTYDAGFGYNFGPQWELTASYRHEKKDGTKPIGAISTKSGLESTVILPDPIDTSTDQFNLGLQYTGERSFMQLAYYGSLFRNHAKSLTWQDPSNLSVFSTQSTSSGPDNQFHQLNLTGGYSFTPATKLVMNASYGRNTQDDALLTDTTSLLPLGNPRSSFDGEVITKALNLKLTTRPVKGLNLAAAYKFDDRENRSPVNTYVFYDINQAVGAAPSTFNAALGLPATIALGGLATNADIYQNRPHSKRVNQLNLDGDYAVARGHTLAAGYEFQKIDRDCNGTWIACEDADTTKEHTVRLDWRARLSDELSGKLGYAYSQRHVNYNVNAWLALAPMANVVGTGAPSSVYQFMIQNGLTGWGPISGATAVAPYVNSLFFTGTIAGALPSGNNIVTSILYASRNQLAENPGMRRYNMADRNRDKFRASLNWDATEQLSFSGGLDLNQDDYGNSVLGLRSAKGGALNLDGTYNLNDALSMSLFYTYEEQRAEQAGWNYVANAPAAAGNITGGCYATVALRNPNNKIDPCNAWTANNKDRTDTIGLTLRHKGIMSGRLDVGGSLVYSRARTDMSVRGGNYAADPLSAPNVLYIPATDLPTVSNTSLELRLTGQYAVDKMSSLRALYTYKRLNSSDYAYDASAPATSMTTVMPTYEVSPHYSQHVFGISYVRGFR